jgi:hypothetical protein
MPKINVTVQHNAGKEVAKQKIQEVIPQLISAFEGKSDTIEWHEEECDFHFKSLGFSIKGHTIITDATVDTEVELPWAAMIYKEKAQKAIEKFTNRAFDKLENE